MVRLLFCFKASASAWPGWGSRPQECKRGSQEHGGLGTIITDAIPGEVNRGEAAVLLQSLCQCLAGRAGRPHECERGPRKHGSLGTIITHVIVAEVNRGEAAVLLQSLCQCLVGRPHGCKRGPKEHDSLGTIGTEAIVAEVDRAEVDRGQAAALLQRLCQGLGEGPHSMAGQVASFPDPATLKAELVGASAAALPSQPSASLIWMSSKVFSEAKACQKAAWGWKEIR